MPKKELEDVGENRGRVSIKKERKDGKTVFSVSLGMSVRDGVREFAHDFGWQEACFVEKEPGKPEVLVDDYGNEIVSGYELGSCLGYYYRCDRERKFGEAGVFEIFAPDGTLVFSALADDFSAKGLAKWEPGKESSMLVQTGMAFMAKKDGVSVGTAGLGLASVFKDVRESFARLKFQDGTPESEKSAAFAKGLISAYLREVSAKGLYVSVRPAGEGSEDRMVRIGGIGGLLVKKSFFEKIADDSLPDGALDSELPEWLRRDAYAYSAFMTIAKSFPAIYAPGEYGCVGRGRPAKKLSKKS